MIILILGAVMVILSVIVLFTYIRFVRRSIKTEATIVKVDRKNVTGEIKPGESGGGSVAVEYMFDGKKYVNVLAENLVDLSDQQRIKEGNKITIYVDTTSPEKVEGTNPRQMFTISIFSLIAGLAFLTVGILSVSGVINL